MRSVKLSDRRRRCAESDISWPDERNSFGELVLKMPTFALVRPGDESGEARWALCNYKQENGRICGGGHLVVAARRLNWRGGILYESNINNGAAVR